MMAQNGPLWPPPHCQVFCDFFWGVHLTSVYDSNLQLKEMENIARGTTDFGYWVYNLNYLLDFIEFVLFLAAGIIQVLDLMLWVRCASGNVFFTSPTQTVYSGIESITWYNKQSDIQLISTWFQCNVNIYPGFMWPDRSFTQHTTLFTSVIC